MSPFRDVSPVFLGGLSLKVQEAELKLRPDVVVSTPGRLIDHVRNTPCFTMDKVEILVLDEADRMLEEVRHRFIHVSLSPNFPFAIVGIPSRVGRNHYCCSEIKTNLIVFGYCYRINFPTFKIEYEQTREGKD